MLTLLYWLAHIFALLLNDLKHGPYAGGEQVSGKKHEMFTGISTRNKCVQLLINNLECREAKIKVEN